MKTKEMYLCSIQVLLKQCDLKTIEAVYTAIHQILTERRASNGLFRKNLRAANEDVKSAAKTRI